MDTVTDIGVVYKIIQWYYSWIWTTLFKEQVSKCGNILFKLHDWFSICILQKLGVAMMLKVV